MSGVVLLSDSASFEMRLRAALAPETGVDRWKPADLPQDAGRAAVALTDDGPDVVCLGPEADVDEILGIAATLDREHPSVGVVFVGELSAELWQRAMRAGVGTIVPAGVEDDDLRLAVARAAETARLRRSAAERPDAEVGPVHRVITVLSPKGGSGKTTIATNLAVTLAHTAPGTAALVDLDLQFGDVAAALHLSPEATLGDVARTAETLDGTAVKMSLTPHSSSLFALCAPETPAEAEDVTYEHAAAAISLLSGEFATVVVDTPAGLGAETLAAIEVSTDLLFVCSLDVPAIRGLRKELDALDRLGMTTQRRGLVLNRADSKVGLAPADVEEVLGMKLSASVPSSREIALSMNEGQPIVESRPRTPAARELARMAGLFADTRLTARPGDGAGSGAGRKSWLRAGR
jgi:pilus assembly protein CpaE